MNIRHQATIEHLLASRELFLPKEVLEYVSDRDDYIAVTDSSAFFKQIIADKPDYIAIDTEDYYEERLGARDGVINLYIDNNPINMPFGISIYYGGKGYWVTDDMKECNELFTADVAPLLVGHNYKFDMHMLQNLGVDTLHKLREGIHPKNVFGDTMTMIHAIDEEHVCNMPDGSQKRSKALKNLAYHYLKGDAHVYEDLVDAIRVATATYLGVSKNEIDYQIVNLLAPEIMKDYACADVEFTYKLYPIFKEMLDKDNTTEAYHIDLGAIVAVWDMQRYGMKVDKAKMQDDRGLLESIRDAALANIREILRRDLNPDSDIEFVEAFQEVFQTTWAFHTEKGELSTAKGTLKLMMEENPEYVNLFTNVLTFRQASKLISTYIDNTLMYIQDDGRVHADFNINPNDYNKGGTKTGRLSSANPNLQNVPKKVKTLTHPTTGVEYTFNPRCYYVADEGFELIFNDYDAQEYSVLGHYSNDAKYIEGLNAGLDIHKFTYSTMFNTDYDAVDEDMRSQGKQLGFSMVYQVGTAALAKALGHDIDVDRLKPATKFMYNKAPAFKYPPYKNWSLDKDAATRMAVSHFEYEMSLCEKEEDRIDMADEYRKVLSGIEHYYEEKVQGGLAYAVKMKKQYFDNFPDIKKFLDQAKKLGAQRMWVRTYWKRKRHIKDKKFAYLLPNAIIQGTCADIMKLKLYEIWLYLLQNGYKSKLVLPVHDEFGTQIHSDEEHLIEKLIEILEELPFRVKITVGLERAQNWGNKTKIK